MRRRRHRPNVLSDGAPIAVVGWSAGGRVALALAARCASLVERAALIATHAPHEEVPWVPEQQHAAMEALRGMSPETVHQRLATQLQPVVVDPAVHLDQALALLGVSSADDDALKQPLLRRELAAMLQGAFAQGAVGMAQDTQRSGRATATGGRTIFRTAVSRCSTAADTS